MVPVNAERKDVAGGEAQPAAATAEPVDVPPGVAPSRRIQVLLATGCGLAVANLYYAQPVLGSIARSMSVTPGQAATVVTVAQALPHSPGRGMLAGTSVSMKYRPRSCS